MNLLWENFEPLFGTWANRIEPFFKRNGFISIYERLKYDSQRGKTICPLSENVFRCFVETPFEELRTILCGFSPYHTMRNNILVADGMLMSCSSTGHIQPSLEQWYRACENELYDGINLNYTKNPDLSYLAHQGVLMLNASLTTEYLKAGAHMFLWEPFMKYLFEEVLSGTNVPIVFLGKEASKLEKYYSPFTWIFKISHPASASYKGEEWNSEGVFKNLNKILWDTNQTKINWLDIPIEENEFNDLPF